MKFTRSFDVRYPKAMARLLCAPVVHGAHSPGDELHR